MKFKYLGENKKMTAFGHDFSDGKTPDVTDPNAIKRLSGNHHFEAVEDDEDKAAAEAAEKEAADKAAADKAAADKKSSPAKASADADKDFPELPGSTK